jgi:hypothetical protein
MTGSTATHDAQRVLADLRDHLARHDRPVAFLFGAGTSCSVKKGVGEASEPLIPAVAGLTSIATKGVAAIGEKHASAWQKIAQYCKDSNQAPNIENMLSRVRMMISAAGGGDTLAGLNRSELCLLEETVRKAIAAAVTPDLGLMTDFPHLKFARWLGKTSRKIPVEIFTVNYDVLIEHSLELERVPAFDGFVGGYTPFFHPDSLRPIESAPGSSWIRLWKMHGSVTWRRVDDGNRTRVVRGAPETTGEMIYPSSQKYDESRQQPYSAFADRMSRFLEQDDALLVVAGFSFGDEHINNLIFGALESRPRTHVFALQFEELPDGCDLIKRSVQCTNLIVIGPETATIGGRRSAWAPVDIPAFMGSAFELQEAVVSGEPTRKIGKMRIGDFNRFCDFLESMTAR